MSRFRTAQSAKRHSSSATVKNWLSQAEGIETLWPSLERLSALQADVENFCQQHHCGLLLVRELHAAELIVLARSPSQAARLRNLQASLLHHLMQRGWHFTRIVVRIQQERFTGSPIRHTADKKGLPGASLESWHELGTRLPAGELKNSVLQLLKRRRPLLNK